jgi:hypothetical protein
METPTTAAGVNASNPISAPEIMLWTARRQRSQELKQIYEGQWIQYWRWYKNYSEPLTDAADWWRSNETIPTVFKVVETILPRILLGMFQSPDWFTVEAKQRRDEQYETMVTQLLRTAMDDMDIFSKMFEAIKYSTIMGHCWGKVIWREEYSDRQVLEPELVTDPETGEETVGVASRVVTEEDYNGVDFEWRPNDRIFPDPTGEGRWYLEEIDATLEELQDIQDQYGIYNKEEFARLKAAIPPSMSRPQGGDSLSDARSGTSAGVSVEYAREPEATEDIPNQIVSPMRDGIGVKLWQCWGWVPQELRNDGSAWRLTVIAEGKYVLRDEPAPTPDGRPPYFPMKSIPIPGRLYGESVLRYVGPLADQQTRLANMRLDEVFLGVWQQYLFRKDSVVSDNQLLMQPGGAIEVHTEPNQNVGDAFEVLERRPLLPEAYKEDEFRQLQAEHAAAASDIMQGVSGNDRQTATEVERRLQQGNARHVLQSLWFDNTVKKELLERTWKWLQMRLTTKKKVRMVGEEYTEVDLTQIQIPVDIVVGGGLFALSKDTRVAMDQELVQLAASPAFAMWMKPGPVLRRLLMDRGWKNPDAFVKTDKEVMLEQMLAAMADQGQAGGAAPPEGTETPRSEGASSGRGDGGNGEVSDVQKQGQTTSMAGGAAGQGGPPAPPTK